MDTSVVSLEEHKKKEFVAPEVADIRLEWDNVRPGIEDILAGSTHLTFLPQHVYSECVNGRATLLTSPFFSTYSRLFISFFSKSNIPCFMAFLPRTRI